MPTDPSANHARLAPAAGKVNYRQMLRSLVRAVLLSLALLAAPAVADDAADRAALDKLFAQLRVADDAETAQDLSTRIWAIWTSPSDPILAGRMREAIVARSTGELTSAIKLLDDLIADRPDYAEAWNQRATIYYMMGDFEHSIADCEKVLALEPRHYGALSGRALMYLQQGNRGLAIKDMAAALAIHPYLNERRLFPELGKPPTHI